MNFLITVYSVHTLFFLMKINYVHLRSFLLHSWPLDVRSNLMCVHGDLLFRHQTCLSPLYKSSRPTEHSAHKAGSFIKMAGMGTQPPKKPACTVGFLTTTLQTLGLIILFYSFSITLTFYNKKFITVSESELYLTSNRKKPGHKLETVFIFSFSHSFIQYVTFEINKSSLFFWTLLYIFINTCIHPMEISKALRKARVFG